MQQLLTNLQESLQEHLLDDDKGIICQLVKPQKGRLEDRLAIYANGYHWRLMDALQKEYLLLFNYLGANPFNELAAAYIAEYPSRSYTIVNFTQYFPEFLLSYQSEQLYLSELAQLIRALSLSLEAADAAILSPTVLAKIPLQSWPSLCFKGHPSVQYLTFQQNTFAFWKALVQKTELPTIQEESSYCLVWRKELKPYAIALTKLQYLTLQGLLTGSCFADVCETVYTHGLNETEAPTFVANCISQWLADHCFSEVYHA